MKFCLKSVLTILLVIFLLGCNSKQKKLELQRKEIERIISEKSDIENRQIKIRNDIGKVRELLTEYNVENQAYELRLEREFPDIKNVDKVKKYKNFLKKSKENSNYQEIKNILERNAFLNKSINDLNRNILILENLILKSEQKLWFIEKIVDRREIDILNSAEEITELFASAEAIIDKSLDPKKQYDIDELTKENFNRLIKNIK